MKSDFKKWSYFLVLGAVLVSARLYAETPAAPVPAGPTVDQRLADLEAYINNGAVGAAGTAKWTSNVPGSGPGHNGWMMVCSALVLFMTLPGLALFYGGLTRQKNILSVMAQCLGIAGVVTILWWAAGYSIVFANDSPTDATGALTPIVTLFGSMKHAFLRGVDSVPNTDYAYWVSHNVFSMYQLMFAIITPALIIGAIAERMKFSAIILFVTLWMFAVYFPLAHAVWGINGMMNGVWNSAAKIHAIDFAGGTVVHMSSGWSALILCIILGKRIGFGTKAMDPHNLVLTRVGTGMLWVGWYGFNAGSAVAADGVSANAFMTTTLATAVASFVWPFLEYIIKRKPTVLGFCSGAVAGLVVITPACGFVNASGSIIIGLLAGSIPFFAVYKLKGWLGYDDALDTFGVHAVGGTMGALVTGFLAVPAKFADGKVNPGAVNANLASNIDAFINSGTLWIEQLKAIGLTLVLSVVATAVIAYLIKFTIGLRPSEEVETLGLDISEHGEEGYRGFQMWND